MPAPCWVRWKICAVVRIRPAKCWPPCAAFRLCRKRQLEEQAAAQKLLPGLAVELWKTRRSIRDWPLEKDSFSAIAAGLEETFRCGRKALASARESRHMQDFHEWRKRVKDHWYHVRLLNRIWGDVMSGYQQALKELEDVLGQDVNLGVMQKQAHEWARQGPRQLPAGSLDKAVQSARRDLRRRALEIGDKIYAEKPRVFSRRLHKLWKAW